MELVVRRRKLNSVGISGCGENDNPICTATITLALRERAPKAGEGAKYNLVPKGGTL